ncbi:MAG: response regulator [Candidatus Omnitrophica bacterium]|nr:response regulator [Candidatus Omnitrophota bacterium]
MFNFIFHQGLKGKFLVVFLLIVAVSAAISCVIVFNCEGRAHRESLRNKGASFARYVADLSRDPVLNHDALALDNIVKSITDDAEVAYAFVYNDKGALLTGFFPSVNLKNDSVRQILEGMPKDCPLAVSVAAVRHGEDIREVTAPVEVDGQGVGSVVVGLSETRINAVIRNSLYYVLLGNLAGCFIAFLLVLLMQRIFINPIISLAGLMRRVAVNQDYAVRAVESTQKDELGELAVGFNSMLKKIQSRDGELESHRDHLEDIVKERTAALRENEHRLELAMQAKSNFISVVSHELRTPLTSIKSSIDILDTEAPGRLTDDQKVFLGRVKLSIDRLTRLINDVLDLSKFESGKMSLQMASVPPCEVINEVVGIQEIVARNKGIALKTEIQDGLPSLLADKDRLIQVLNNLISNAFKFTKQGSVVVSASCRDQRNLVFCVRDTGSGIKAEDLPKMFQKFHQVGDASQQLGGTGLGLAICKEIVEQLGGQIRVESEFGKGSVFSFSIPIRHDKRILVVDDDRGTLEVVRGILKATDKFEVELAADGFIAGQKYLEFDPHLIILDIGLPKLNGLEVCARIKGDPRTMQTKIIMMSADIVEMEQKSRTAGADDILKKPVNREELLLKISKLI